LAGPRVFTFVFRFSLTGFATAPPNSVMNARFKYAGNDIDECHRLVMASYRCHQKRLHPAQTARHGHLT
jgi:hypothetical protein